MIWLFSHGNPVDGVGYENDFDFPAIPHPYLGGRWNNSTSPDAGTDPFEYVQPYHKVPAEWLRRALGVKTWRIVVSMSGDVASYSFDETFAAGQITSIWNGVTPTSADAITSVGELITFDDFADRDSIGVETYFSWLDDATAGQSAFFSLDPTSRAFFDTVSDTWYLNWDFYASLYVNKTDPDPDFFAAAGGGDTSGYDGTGTADFYGTEVEIGVDSGLTIEVELSVDSWL